MANITLEEIMEISEIKEKINSLYETLYDKSKEIMDRCGETSVYYPIQETETGEKFVRIKVIDNIKKLTAGRVFTSTSFSPVSLDIDFLKREPKEKEPINEGK